MKEHCFSIAIEAPSDQKDTTVLGRLVSGLHHAGFVYMNVKEISKDDYWNRSKKCPKCNSVMAGNFTCSNCDYVAIDGK